MKTKHITLIAILSVFFIGAFQLYNTSNKKCDYYRMNQYIESRTGSLAAPTISKLAESLYCYK